MPQQRISFPRGGKERAVWNFHFIWSRSFLSLSPPPAPDAPQGSDLPYRRFDGNCIGTHDPPALCAPHSLYFSIRKAEKITYLETPDTGIKVHLTSIYACCEVQRADGDGSGATGCHWESSPWMWRGKHISGRNGTRGIREKSPPSFASSAVDIPHVHRALLQNRLVSLSAWQQPPPSQVLSCFKSFVGFYESTLNRNISMNTYSI